MTPAALRSTAFLAALAALLGGCGGCGRSDGAEPGALHPGAMTAEAPVQQRSAKLAHVPAASSERMESLEVTQSAGPESAARGSAAAEVGSIEVRVLGADGEPDTEYVGTISLIDAIPGEASFQHLLWFGEGTSRTAPLVEGVARFDDLLLGRSWTARVEASDWFGPQPTRSCTGPTQRGQHVVLDLLDGSRARLTGRLVDEAGRTAGAAQWRFQALAPERHSLQVTTDASGDFALELDLSALGGATSEVRHELNQFSNAPTDRTASFMIPAASSRQRDLGDIIVRTLPTLASGTVVDVRGAPIAGARVGLDVADAPHGIRTGFVGFVEVRTREDGTFDIPDDPRGRRLSAEDLETARLWLTALAEGAAPETIEVQRGARELRLVLVPAGRMRARLAHEDQELCEYFVCYAQHVGSISRARGVRDGDTWTFEPLKPGTYRLEVILSYTTEPLLVVEGLHVPGGGECVDPRLAPLHLDAHIGRARFDVRDRGGQAVDGVMLGFLNDAPGAWPGDVFWRREAPRDEHGVWWPRPALRPLQVLVGAEGYRQSEARPLETLHRVELERRRLLRLVPKDGLGIADSVQLHYVQGQNKGYVTSADGRTFELWDQEPGPMQVRYGTRWWLPKNDPRRDSPLEWLELEVPEDQDLELVLDLRQE